jgi:hypothetical protein
VTAVWTLVAIAIAAAVVTAASAWLRRDRHHDLGAVSNQWIAEQRLGSSQNPHR